MTTKTSVQLSELETKTRDELASLADRIEGINSEALESLGLSLIHI